MTSALLITKNDMVINQVDNYADALACLPISADDNGKIRIAKSTGSYIEAAMSYMPGQWTKDEMLRNFLKYHAKPYLAAAGYVVYRLE